MNEQEIRASVRLFERDRSRYEGFTEAIRVLLSRLLSQEGIPFENVTARTKDRDSLTAKLNRHPNYSDVSNVPDLVGVRVVTRYQADVEAVCQLIANQFVVAEGVTHGGEEPHAFGYTSRHMIVELIDSRVDLPEWSPYADLWAEIQVRSVLQHAWASISHGLDYKTDGEIPRRVRRQLFRVAALLETGDELFDDFRAQVEDVRSSYDREVAGDDWQSLPLDLDALKAAVSRLPLRKAFEAARSCGWRHPADLGAGRSSLSYDAWDPLAASRLIRVAAAGRLTTVGDVAAILLSALSDSEWLSGVAERAERRGFAPWANPYDVGSLRIISGRPLEQVVEAAQEVGFEEALIEAAVENKIDEEC